MAAGADGLPNLVDGCGWLGRQWQVLLGPRMVGGPDRKRPPLRGTVWFVMSVQSAMGVRWMFQEVGGWIRHDPSGFRAAA